MSGLCVAKGITCLVGHAHIQVVGKMTETAHQMGYSTPAAKLIIQLSSILVDSVTTAQTSAPGVASRSELRNLTHLHRVVNV
jgi:hypothetical protein